MNLRDFFRNLDAEDLIVFLHVTVAFFFVAWGLEVILPWSVWRLLVGFYIAAWVGLDLFKELWGTGFYILRDQGEPPSLSEE